MFRKNLHVALFGVSDPLSAAVRAVEPLERFTHSFDAFDSFDEEAFLASDVVIAEAAALDFPSLPSLVEARRQRLAGAFGAFAVVASPAELASWPEERYELVDAVWASPLDKARARFELGRLQREARLASELRLARTYLDTAIDSTPELIWYKDKRGAHLKVNEAFCATVEKTKEQVEGRGHYYIWDITPEEYATGEYVCLESEDETMEAGRTCLFDEQVKTTRGMRQFKTYKSPLFDEDGSIMGTVGIAHDVTDLGNIATELEILINAMPFSMVIEDADGIILNANRETERCFKMDRHNIIGGNIKDWRRLVFSEELAKRREIYEDAEFEAVIGGEPRVLEMSKTPIVDVFGTKTGLLRIYRDITAERELEKRAITNARTDYLTGLYNRRYFYEFLDERERGEALTLIALDLDDFKGINDLNGHAIGDEVLLEASALLREAFPDGVVIRWGGDEFVVALFGPHDLSELKERSRALLARFADGEQAGGGRISFTGSIGIAVSDDADLTIDELIRRSDEALYRAKRAGKSQCCAYGESGPAPAPEGGPKATER